MRIVSYNILDGGGGRADPIAEVLAAQRADVVVLVEATDPWVVRRVARRLRLDVILADGSGEGGRVSAVAVLSRYPIARSVNRSLLHGDGPRAWIEVELRPAAGPPVTVVALHLSARATLADERRRVAELNVVLTLTAALRRSGRPHVLVGDFNATAPGQRVDTARCQSSTRQAFAANGGLLPRDAIDRVLKAGYVDTLAAAHGDDAFDEATFTTHESGQRVDYVFAFGLRTERAWIERDRLATYASDHYPVGADLVA